MTLTTVLVGIGVVSAVSWWSGFMAGRLLAEIEAADREVNANLDRIEARLKAKRDKPEGGGEA